MNSIQFSYIHFTHQHKDSSFSVQMLINSITAQILIGRCNVTVCINATGHWTCSPGRPPAATARCSNTALQCGHSGLHRYRGEQRKWGPLGVWDRSQGCAFTLYLFLYPQLSSFKTFPARLEQGSPVGTAAHTWNL